MISGIIEIISDNAPLCAVVGNNERNTKPKFFWVVCGENEKPPYVILRRSVLSPNQMKGSPSLVDSQNFESYTYAKTVEQAELIDEMIRVVIENDGNGFTTDAGYLFQRIFIVDKSDGFDKEAGYPFIRSHYTAMFRRLVVT